MKKKKIAIIGGGLVGIQCLLHLLKSGEQNVVLFEKGNEVGGLWNRNSSSAKTYEGLRTNALWRQFIIEQMPVDPGAFRERYPRAESLQQYAVSCVDRQGCRENFLFGHTVTRIVAENGGGGGSNHVTVHYEKDGGESGRPVAHKRTFDFVYICTGQCSETALPDVPGLDVLSRGKNCFHLSDTYASQGGFRSADMAGKRVLVVGAGFSGVDAIQNVCRDARSAVLASRSPTRLLRRIYLPPTLEMLDLALGSSITLLVQAAYDALDWVCGMPAVLRNNGTVGTGSVVVDSQDLKLAIRLGYVDFRAAVTKFYVAPDDEGTLCADFADGTSYQFDVVIFATGFSRRIIEMSNGDRTFQTIDEIPLYESVIPLGLPGCAFIHIGHCCGGPHVKNAQCDMLFAEAYMNGLVKVPAQPAADEVTVFSVSQRVCDYFSLDHGQRLLTRYLGYARPPFNLIELVLRPTLLLMSRTSDDEYWYFVLNGGFVDLPGVDRKVDWILRGAMFFIVILGIFLLHMH